MSDLEDEFFAMRANAHLERIKEVMRAFLHEPMWPEGRGELEVSEGPETGWPRFMLVDYAAREAIAYVLEGEPAEEARVVEVRENEYRTISPEGAEPREVTEDDEGA